MHVKEGGQPTAHFHERGGNEGQGGSWGCSSQTQEGFALGGLGNQRGGQVDQIDHLTKMLY